VRVLHVCAYFAPAFGYGGPPRSVLGLCKSLRELGVDAEVLATTADGLDELEPGRRTFEGVPVEYLPRTFPKRFFNAAGFGKRLDALVPNFDLLHVHGLWNLTVWKACAAARRNNKRYVISPRGMLDTGSMRKRARLKSGMYRVVERKNLANATMIHATSESEAEAVRRFDLPTLVKVVPNGVGILEPDAGVGNALRFRLGIADRDPVVCYLGRIAPLKRFDLMAAALQIVLHSLPNARLLIAGPDEGGYRRVAESLFAKVRLSVHWLGEIDGDEKRSLFAASQATVCCSDSESFGMSVAEALGASVPAVVAKTCPWAILDEFDAGRWVEQTPTAIAKALIEVLSDSSKARAMGERGRKLIQERFSWEGVGRAMVQLYQEASA
jgi:glycosyltransferase involved in cell wall biosynthesis